MFKAWPILFFLLFITKGHAILIGPENYFTPQSLEEILATNPMHPLFGREEIIQNSFKATVFVPRRGTAVVISPDGLILTAAHVISHLYIGETKSCPKLHFHLFHQTDASGARQNEVILNCQEILLYDYNKDVALIRAALPTPNYRFAFAPLAPIQKAPFLEDTYAFIIGHPGASSFESSLAVFSEGKIFFDGTEVDEAPHFLHLIDTEGGHSGSPVFNANGEVLGVHSKGIPEYSQGVEGTLNGARAVFKQFNVAMRYVLKDFLK